MFSNYAFIFLHSRASWQLSYLEYIFMPIYDAISYIILDIFSGVFQDGMDSNYSHISPSSH